MLKKFGPILLILVIMIVYSAGAFAYPTEGVVGTTQTAINSSAQKDGSSTESGITSKNGITGGSGVTSESGITGGSGVTSGSSVTSGSGVTSESSITSGSAIDGKNDDASPDLEYEVVFEDALKNGKAIDNGEFFVTITSPDKEKDSTYKKTYILSGNSDSNDIIITIAKYNEGTKEYERMYNTDGESSWEINSTGVFSKEIQLTMGVNKIKIMASRMSQRLKEVQEDDFQINCFTIELLNESIQKLATRKTNEIGMNIGEDITYGVKSFIDFLFKKTQ